jgi:multidrug efflux pump subunit AcrB
MSPRDLEANLTTPYERLLTTTVDNIEHIESESLFGISVIKIYLQPSASVPRAIAQVTSISQAAIKNLPPVLRRHWSLATVPPTYQCSELG